ncbi:hypothetical protein LG198_09060 [Methylobacillus arboreus]|uniref:hypothetical protein n=1 Tax=Methylobacillus arboreus TaxID=755170 RepID=UPI001E29E639|nr:hypothetical protein [Methylobacillus arboreus]MCB5190874.1 hypothetical protein [Methylobacillus arboreus]
MYYQRHWQGIQQTLDESKQGAGFHRPEIDDVWLESDTVIHDFLNRPGICDVFLKGLP